MAHKMIPRKGHKYVIVVVDHDTRRLVWAAPGRNSATVREFFDLLGPQRCAQITHVSADGADFIDTIVAQMCPGATRVADPFHVVKWATEALDEVRRGAWNDARELARTEAKRGRGRPRADAPARPGSERATALKGCRYSLWKYAAQPNMPSSDADALWGKGFRLRHSAYC